MKFLQFEIYVSASSGAQHILPRVPVKLLHFKVFENIITLFITAFTGSLILSFSSLFLLFLPSSPLNRVFFSGVIMAAMSSHACGSFRQLFRFF